MLWQCPNLVSIDLSENAVDNLSIFQNQVSTATGKKSRLRRLNLDDDHASLSHREGNLVVKSRDVLSLVPLLERNPELGDLGRCFMLCMDMDRFPPQVQNVMDMNRFGRVLF
jgi:hypothetical protein